MAVAGHDPSRHGRVAVAGPETLQQIISWRQRAASHPPGTGSWNGPRPYGASRERRAGKEVNRRLPEPDRHGSEPGLRVCPSPPLGSGTGGQDRLPQRSYTWGARPTCSSLLVCWQTVFGLSSDARP